MTVDELRALIAIGETLDVEFKGEERQPIGDNELVEAGLVEGRGERKGTFYVVAPKYMGESQTDMGAPINPPRNERKSK